MSAIRITHRKWWWITYRPRNWSRGASAGRLISLGGGKREGKDEPGIEGGKLMKFVAEIEPSRPTPTSFIAPGSLFVGTVVFPFARFTVEFTKPMLGVGLGRANGNDVQRGDLGWINKAFVRDAWPSNSMP